MSRARLAGRRGLVGGVGPVVLVACGTSAQPSTGGLGGASGAPADRAGDGAASGATGPTAAGIELRVSSPIPAAALGGRLLSFAGGGAVTPGLESLEYYITTIQICEELEIRGSGYSNARGCLDLYSGDRSRLNYQVDADWAPLADEARGIDSGFVNLMDPESRRALNSGVPLEQRDVRTYRYGVINWSLPVKIKATVRLGDGSLLYTHDGPTSSELVGTDGYRHYFTAARSPLDEAPAEKAVVLLGNGGNWFKFQSPLSVTEQDLNERRQWILDLVFNPEGIVKGFAGEALTNAELEERSSDGRVLRSISVPMLDLAPVPHRADQRVLRESYLAPVRFGAHSFDVRLELYSVEGDANHTIYGVDAKTLVTAQTTEVPPQLTKVALVRSTPSGSLEFLSYKESPIFTGFTHVPEVGGITHAALRCATHADRVGAEGGAAIVVEACPAPEIAVDFRLEARVALDQAPITLSAPDGGASAPPADGAVSAPMPADAEVTAADAATPTDAGATSPAGDAG